MQEAHGVNANPGKARVYEVLGRTVTMPCMVRDARAMHVLYPVDLQVAAELVGQALEPVEIQPGKGQLVLGCVDYLDNDLGQYLEVMMVFFVRPRWGAARREGTFIYKLPVDGEFTCAAGRQIWGFPKSVERITLQHDGSTATCTLAMEETNVFRLTMPTQGGIPGKTPEAEMLTYTYHPTLHAVPFASAGRGVRMFPGGEGVHLELGAHPLAGELRRLGLPAPPLMAIWTEHFTGRFDAPIPVSE